MLYRAAPTAACPGGLLKTREDPGDLRSAKQVSEANWGGSRKRIQKGDFARRRVLRAGSIP